MVALKARSSSTDIRLNCLSRAQSHLLEPSWSAYGTLGWIALPELSRCVNYLLKGIDLLCHCLHARHDVIADVNTEGRGTPGRHEGKAPPPRSARSPERSVSLALVVRSRRVVIDGSGCRWCPRRSDPVKHVC